MTAVLLTGMTAAQYPDQNHPLSEIYPVDKDFNVSDQDIFNVSEIRMNNGIPGTGLVINDFRIRDDNNVNILELDKAENEWIIEGADLNLSGNQLMDVGGLEDCSSGEALLGDGSCAPTQPQNLSEVLEAGNAANQSIEMDGNDINSANSISFRDSGDRVFYGGSAGLLVERSYGEDATLHKVWSPPESQGGKEATTAMVVGDNDEYVYDVYNNAGYDSGDRASQWGISLKYQNGAESIPFVFDFDKSSLGGGSNVERLRMTPDGPLESGV